MILPSNHHFTKLVVSAEHITLHHAGPQLLIASLREKYWIPRIRKLVKKVIHQCLTCYNFMSPKLYCIMRFCIVFCIINNLMLIDYCYFLGLELCFLYVFSYTWSREDAVARMFVRFYLNVMEFG